MDTNQFKESVKSHCDIVDIIHAYIPLKHSGKTHKALCPFHTEKTPSFTVNSQKQMFYCFGCQKGGDVIRFVMEYERLDFPQALTLLAAKAGLSLPESEERSKSGSSTIIKQRLYNLCQELCIWYQDRLHTTAGKTSLDYLKQRGLSQELIAKFQCGYAPNSWSETLLWGKKNGYSPEELEASGTIITKEDKAGAIKRYDRFRDRIMFPIWNEQGFPIGFSGRMLPSDKDQPKYINSPESPLFQKKKTLYGLAIAREAIGKQDQVILCEGPMDVIACHQADMPNAVAVLGTAFTGYHANILKRYTNSVAILFDGDQAGINATLRSAAIFLPLDIVPHVVSLAPDEDPDSILQKQGKDVLISTIKHAKNYFSFRISSEQAKNRMNNPAEKEKAVLSILQDIMLLQSVFQREEYGKLVAHAFAIPEPLIHQMLTRIGRSSPRKKRENNPDLLHDASPSEDCSLLQEKENVLLDIIMHHELLAQQLLEDLPAEYISHAPVGQILRESLAYVEQGEWSELEEILTKNHDYASIIAKLMFDSEYPAPKDQHVVMKAYTDSLKGIIGLKISEKMKSIGKQMISCSTKEERGSLFKEHEILRKQKEENFEQHTSEHETIGNRASHALQHR